MNCSGELPGFSIARFHFDSGQAVVVSAAVPEAEGLVPKALPEREESALKARFETDLVHSAGRSAAFAVAEDSAAGSVAAKERFVQTKEAESRSAVGWAVEKEWAKAHSETVLVHSAGRLAASAAAEDSAAGSVVAKGRFVQAWSRSVVRRAAKAWSKARFQVVVVHSAGRLVAIALAEGSLQAARAGPVFVPALRQERPAELSQEAGLAAARAEAVRVLVVVRCRWAEAWSRCRAARRADSVVAHCPSAEAPRFQVARRASSPVAARFHCRADFAEAAFRAPHPPLAVVLVFLPSRVLLGLHPDLCWSKSFFPVHQH